MKSLNSRSSVLFYAHYNKFDRVEDYVIYQLQQMRPIFDKIVLISNTPVSDNDQARLGPLCDRLMQRPNVGYDFAAWRDGMNDFGWDELAKCDEVTVMNDTCFGPLFDFAAVHDEMQSRAVDFWGMTTNIALTDLLVDSSGKTIFAPAHIQSYYMTFNSAVVSSSVFKDFWVGVKDFTDVLDVITNYEIRLTELLASKGFTHDSYYDAVKYWGVDELDKTKVDISAWSTGDMTKYNPGYTCNRPLWLLQTVDRYPFIKTKAVRLVPAQLDGLRKFIIENTNYPVELIDGYIGARYYSLWQEKDDDIQFLLHSRAFRLGRFLLTPLRLLKHAIRKANPEVNEVAAGR